MVKAYNIGTFVEGDAFYAISIMFILYGWGIIPFTYIFGYVFKGYGNA
jgi:ATP-binding cassette subfamily A (ABC1) protein 3